MQYPRMFSSSSFRVFFFSLLVTTQIASCSCFNSPKSPLPSDTKPPKKSDKQPDQKQPSYIKFFIDKPNIADAEKDFTLCLERIGELPINLSTYQLQFNFSAEEGGAGSLLGYQDVQGVNQKIAASIVELKKFTAQPSLQTEQDKVFINFTLEPGAGVKQVVVKLTLLPDNQVATLTWKISGKSVITDAVIQAAQGAGWDPDLIQVLKEMQKGNEVPLNSLSHLFRKSAGTTDGDTTIIDALSKLPGFDLKTNNLLHSAQSGNMVDYLVDHGVDLERKDSFGNYTPLCSAVNENKLEVVQALVSKGASIDCVTKSGDTVLHLLFGSGSEAENFYLANFLLKNGAQKHLNTQNDHKLTPLHRVVIYKKVSLIKALIEAGADPNIEANLDQEEKLPLTMAIASGNLRVFKALIAYDQVDVNLKHKQFPCTAPLHVAAAKGSLEMVRLLLARKADKAVLDGNGKTPFAYANELPDGPEKAAILALLTV